MTTMRFIMGSRKRVLYCRWSQSICLCAVCEICFMSSQSFYQISGFFFKYLKMYYNESPENPQIPKKYKVDYTYAN